MSTPIRSTSRLASRSRISYNEFDEVEPGLQRKVLRAVTPELEWLSFVPVVGDLVDMAMPAAGAAQCSHQEAVLAAATAAAPASRSASSRRPGSGRRRQLHALRWPADLRGLSRRHPSLGSSLGDFCELLTGDEEMAMFVCEDCGHLEFFMPMKK